MFVHGECVLCSGTTVGSSQFADTRPSRCRRRLRHAAQPDKSRHPQRHVVLHHGSSGGGQRRLRVDDNLSLQQRREIENNWLSVYEVNTLCINAIMYQRLNAVCHVTNTRCVLFGKRLDVPDDGRFMGELIASRHIHYLIFGVPRILCERICGIYAF